MRGILDVARQQDVRAQSRRGKALEKGFRGTALASPKGPCREMKVELGQSRDLRGKFVPVERAQHFDLGPQRVGDRGVLRVAKVDRREPALLGRRRLFKTQVGGVEYQAGFARDVRRHGTKAQELRVRAAYMPVRQFQPKPVSRFVDMIEKNAPRPELEQSGGKACQGAHRCLGEEVDAPAGLAQGPAFLCREAISPLGHRQQPRIYLVGKCLLEGIVHLHAAHVGATGGQFPFCVDEMQDRDGQPRPPTHRSGMPRAGARGIKS